MIMSIATTLYEEKIMDPILARMLNPNMDFYRLAGIGDVGELVVHMMTGKGYDERGPIGLGEPPTVGPMAALPMPWPTPSAYAFRSCRITPDRVVSGAQHQKEAAMRPFDYASPTTQNRLPALLGKSWGEVEILAGGT